MASLARAAAAQSMPALGQPDRTAASKGLLARLAELVSSPAPASAPEPLRAGEAPLL